MLGIIVKLVLSVLIISGVGCAVTCVCAKLVPQLKNNEIFYVIDFIFTIAFTIALVISIICLIVLGLYGSLYFIWSF